MTEPIKLLKAKRDLRATASGLFDAMRGGSSGLEALIKYAKSREEDGITEIDAITTWASLGEAKAIEKEDAALAKAETEPKEEKPQRRPAVNQEPDGDITSRIYYDGFKRSYVMRNNRGSFLSLESRQITRRLKMMGLSSAKNEFGVSEIDETINAIEEDNDVGYSGPLAGYASGVVNFGQMRALITTGCEMPHDEKGEWPKLAQVFETLFGHEQLDYFYSWLHFSVRSLDSRTHAPGQAIAIAGKKGCGKSLCQQLITAALGGRCARPYQYMINETQFNSDLFGAEHLMVEDEANSTSTRDRKVFGCFVKNIVANKDQRLHGKGKDAVMLQPLWRLSITTNDNPENLMVLPPLEDGLEDKIMLFKANFAQLPMPAGTPEEKRVFWGALMAEMPAFMHFLRHEWFVPPEIEDPRYGVKHYHNPVILMALNALTPEMHMLSMIDAYLMQDELAWHGTHSKLMAELTDKDIPCSFEARKLFNWPTACGTYLGRLHKNLPDRVQKYRHNGERHWRIIPKVMETELDL
jgi:hypothetical protein